MAVFWVSINKSIYSVFMQVQTAYLTKCRQSLFCFSFVWFCKVVLIMYSLYLCDRTFLFNLEKQNTIKLTVLCKLSDLCHSCIDNYCSFDSHNSRYRIAAFVRMPTTYKDKAILHFLSKPIYEYDVLSRCRCQQGICTSDAFSFPLEYLPSCVRAIVLQSAEISLSSEFITRHSAIRSLERGARY